MLDARSAVDVPVRSDVAMVAPCAYVVTPVDSIDAHAPQIDGDAMRKHVDGDVDNMVVCFVLCLMNCGDLRRMYGEHYQIALAMRECVQTLQLPLREDASKLIHTTDKIYEGVQPAYEFLCEQYNALVASVNKANQVYHASSSSAHQRELVRVASLNAALAKVRTCTLYNVANSLTRRVGAASEVHTQLQDTLASYEEPFEHALASVGVFEEAFGQLASIGAGRAHCDALRAWRGLAEASGAVEQLAPHSVEELERWEACLLQCQSDVTRGAQAVSDTWSMPPSEEHLLRISDLRLLLDEARDRAEPLLRRIEECHEGMQQLQSEMLASLTLTKKDIEAFSLTARAMDVADGAT